MPLSEADFYAYSRATGTPVPRDAQERAAAAPQVLGFRQGQLSATKEELDGGNFIDTAGKTALIAGLGAGAAALATGGRFGKLREALAGKVRPKDKGATAGVRPVDLNVEDIPVEKVSVQNVTSSAPTARTGSFGDIYQDLRSNVEVSPSVLALPAETEIGRRQRIYEEVRLRNPRGAGTSADAQFTPKSVDVDISAKTGREEPLPEYLARARETSPERFQELDILQGNMDMADLFYRTKGTGKDVPALPAAMTPRSYLESTGAIAPAPSSALRKGRDPVDVLLEERELAAQRNRAQAIRAEEAKVIGKGERLLAELQAEKPQVSSWPEISGQLKQLDVSISGAPEAQGGSGIDLIFSTKVGDKQFNLYSPQSQQMLEKVGLTADQVEAGWISNLKSKGILESSSTSTLVEKQNARRPLVSEQSVEAVDTGADQVVGRVMEDVQRNEDLNISSAAKYLNNRRDEIASMLGEQGLTVTPGRIEQALGYEFGPKAYTFGPKQTQRKQALQLGATYNTNFFENLKTPSVQVAEKTMPTSSLKQPTVMKETAERLASQAGKVKSFLEDVRLDVEPRIEGLTVRRDQLIEKQRDLLDKQNMALAYLGKNPGLGSPRDNSLTGYLRQIN